MSSPDTGAAEARLDARVAAIDVKLDAAVAPLKTPAPDSPPVAARRPFKDQVKERSKQVRDWADKKEGQARGAVKGFAHDVATPDFTVKDFEAIDAEKKIAADLAAARIEAERNPRKAGEILDAMDADATLMRKILESRSGLRGIWNRLSEKLSVKGVRLTSVLGTAVGAKVLGYGETALKIANPLAGAVTGGVLGGFWGYIRGKNKQESASKWMSDLNLSEKDAATMDVNQLDIAIGVINNAVHEGRVQGGREELRELMRTYRYMKQAREAKAQEETERDPQKELLDKINLETAVEDEIGKALSAQAGEKYKELYEQIIKGKKKEMISSALKGAVIGASVGTALGIASEHVSAWWNAHHGTHGAAGAHGQTPAIKEGIQKAAETHAQNAAVATNPNAPLPQGMTEVQRMDLLQHASNLMRVPGAHIEGFTPDGLHSFTQMIKDNVPFHNIAHEATINNIDLGALTNHGQRLGDFIMANKDTFVRLAPEFQRQILSYPSVAAEILASAATTGAAVTGSLTSIAIGGAALGAIGFGVDYLGEKEKFDAIDKAVDEGEEKQKERDKTLKNAAKLAEDNAKEKVDEEEENRLTGFEANVAAAKTELIGKEIWLAEYPNRLYRVASVDAEGQLGFVYTEADKVKLQSDEESELPHPEINIEDLVNENGNLDSSKVKITSSEARVERRPAGRTETAELQELASSGDFVKATLTKITLKVGPQGERKDKEYWAIKLASNTVVKIEPKNANTICAGKKVGDKVEVKIDAVEPMIKRPQSVYNVTLSLKPKEEPKPEADKTGGPKPAEDRFKQMEAHFSPEGVIDEGDLDTLDEVVGDYAGKLIDKTKKAPRVVVSKPDGSEFYMLVATADEKYVGWPFDTLNQRADRSKATEITARDLTNGWKLFMGKEGSGDE